MEDNKNLECTNCGFLLQESHKFCPNCGQKTFLKRLTVKLFFQEFVSSIFGLDSKIKRTVIKTITKPGIVALDFVNGRRQLYVNPFRFYLVVSIIFFLLTELVTKFEDSGEPADKAQVEFAEGAVKINFGEPNQSADSIQNKIKVDYAKESDFKDKIFFKRSASRFNSAYKLYIAYPEINSKQVIDSIGCEPTRYNKFLVSKGEKFNDVIGNRNINDLIIFMFQKLPLILFFTLPFYAIIFWIFYYRKRLSLAEHMVFVFQYASVIFIVLTFFLIVDFTFNSDLGNFFIPLTNLFLFYKSLRNFYQQSRLKTILKILLMSGIFGIALVLTFLFVFVLLFLLY